MNDPFSIRMPSIDVHDLRSTTAMAAEEQLMAAKNAIEEISGEIEAFQTSLSQDEETWFSMMGAGGGLMLRPEKLTALGIDKIVIDGEDQEGRRVRAVQHVSQVNVVLIAVKADKPMRIGFGGA